MSSPLLSLPPSASSGSQMRNVEMQEKGSASASAAAIDIPSPSPQQYMRNVQNFNRNLEGIRTIAFVTDLTTICNWFLGVCALTWASAVLLGAYIAQLSMWDYYDVALLLFVEGLRFGIAAAVRLLGYRLSDLIRWTLRSVAFFLPLGMGGFAVLSILPRDIHLSIHHRFSGYSHHRSGMLHVITTISHTVEPAPPPSDSSYSSFAPSLRIFYLLILSNAFVVLLGTSIVGLMRRRFVRSTVRSLTEYYNKMMYSPNSWLDLEEMDHIDFAFQIQGKQYRNGRSASYVCENYADLICYLYMHDKGVKAAETALASEDGYVREAAVNIIGFWAIFETIGVKGCNLETSKKGGGCCKLPLCFQGEMHPSKEEGKPCKLPLCFQRGMLSKLADITAESYGSLSNAAARSFALLLKLVDLELICTVASVPSKTAGNDLIGILLSRAAEMLYPPWPSAYQLPSELRCALQNESLAHVYALREYLHRLQELASKMTATDASFIAGHREQLVKKIKDAIPQLVDKVHNSDEFIIQSLANKIASLLPSAAEHDQDLLEKYSSEIKTHLEAQPARSSWSTTPIEASFLLLFNVGFPLACLGVGFIVNALM